jgi:hypothetical protein
MANHVTNNISVVGNEDVENKMNELLEQLEDIPYSDTGAFAKVFYNNPELGEGGGTMNSWAGKNIGAKWAYFEHRQDTMDFQVTSAWYPVTAFAMNLYNQLVELDPEVAVELRYEDETYDPVGAILVYDKHIFQEEDENFEYPDEEDYEDDYDEYDNATMNFMDSIGDYQNDIVDKGYTTIKNGEGNPFVFEEMSTETV